MSTRFVERRKVAGNDTTFFESMDIGLLGRNPTIDFPKLVGSLRQRP